MVADMTAQPDDSNDRRESVWDAVVIGAGVAGCVLSRELAREGLRTLLVESKPFPRPKVCGACYNGLALSVFEQAGLMHAVHAAGAVPLERFEAMRRGQVLKVPIYEGLAVSRTALDDILAQAAVEAGVTFRDGTTGVVAPARAGAEFREVRLQTHEGVSTVAAKVVIVAAGLGRTCFEADSVHRSRFSKHAKIGLGCILAEAPASYRPGVIHMAIGRSGYLGLVRVEHGQLNVAGAFTPDFVKLHGSPGAAAVEVLKESGFANIPGLADVKWIGTPPLSRRTRPLADDRVFLVGDAAGYVEPFTGEGMGWALASAMALKPIAVKAAERWNPRFCRQWEQSYERIVGRRQGICRVLAAILNRPALSTIVFRVARVAPALTSRIVRRIDAPSPPVSESVIPT